MGGSLHLLLDMLVVCWVKAAVEMSRYGHSHSSSSFQVVSTILALCLTLSDWSFCLSPNIFTQNSSATIHCASFSLSPLMETEDG